MVTLFGILNIGARGLVAAQSALDTTGHNISNASTEGYSRQRVVQRATEPIQTAIGIFGGGTDIVTVERIRDLFLDAQVRGAQSGSGFYEELNDVFLRIEAILNDTLTPVSDSADDPASGGLNNLISRFYSAWQELSNSPEAREVRSAVLEAGRAVAELFNTISAQLVDFRTNLNDRVEGFVDEIDRLAQSIASLNGRIATAEAGQTHQSNDLRDERDHLLDRLAEIVPTQTFDVGSGQIAVNILGMRLVDGIETNLLETRTATGGAIEIDHIFFERQALQALDFELEEGRLGGVVDARDRIVPELADQIDQLARSFIQEVNRIHSAAAGIEGYQTLTSDFSLSTGAESPDATVTLDTLFNNPLLAPDVLTSECPFGVAAGECTIRVATQDNQTRGTFSVDVRLSDNINDVVERIDRADGVVSVARSAYQFDPVFFSEAKSAVSFDSGDVTTELLSNLFPDVPVGFEPGPFQLEIHIKDAAGNLVDSNPATSAIDPFVVTPINPGDTLDDLANEIVADTLGRATVDFVTDPDDPSKVQFRLRAARSDETISVRVDTSGVMRAMGMPITDPTLPLVGGTSDQATGTFAAGQEAVDFITAATPNFSTVFPGPPPSVIGEGSFDVVVVDALGNIRPLSSQTITISDGGVETINGVRAALDALPDLNVSVTAQGELVIETINDTHFFFRNDTTGLIEALGLDEIDGHGEINGVPFQSGTFEVVVANERGTVTDILTVDIDADPVTGVESLSDIAQAIEDAANKQGAPITASLVPSPKDPSMYVLQIKARDGYQFTFRSDDSLLLAALGFADGPVLDPTGDNPLIGAGEVTRVGDNIGPSVSASWDEDRNIVIKSAGTDEITFLNDTSHFLASVGLNGFFRGADAVGMQVNEELVDNLWLLAASKTGAPGDNQAALAMGELNHQAVLDGGSHGDYYRSIISKLGNEVSRASRFSDVNEKLLEAFGNMREETSGVSLDEESINLIRFQQAFQASARMISTLDQLLTTVISMGVG